MDLLTIAGFVTGGIGTAYTIASYYVERSAKRRSQTLAEQQNQTIYTQVMSTQKFPIGCINFPPLTIFERTIEGDVFSELYVELLRYIGGRTDITMNFVTTRASQIVPQLKDSEVFAVACLLDTPGRAQLGDLADPRLGVAVVGVVRKEDAEGWSHERLRDRGTTVAAVVGEVGEEVARTRYGATSNNGRLLTIDTDYVPALFSQVERGNADIALAAGTRWIQYARGFNDPAQNTLTTVFVDPPLLLVPCGIFVRKDSGGLREWLENELREGWAQPSWRARLDSLIDEYYPFIVSL